MEFLFKKRSKVFYNIENFTPFFLIILFVVIATILLFFSYL